jgi:hypothetical protein
MHTAMGRRSPGLVSGFHRAIGLMPQQERVEAVSCGKALRLRLGAELPPVGGGSFIAQVARIYLHVKGSAGEH